MDHIANFINDMVVPIFLMTFMLVALLLFGRTLSDKAPDDRFPGSGHSEKTGIRFARRWEILAAIYFALYSAMSLFYETYYFLRNFRDQIREVANTGSATGSVQLPDSSASPDPHQGSGLGPDAGQSLTQPSASAEIHLPGLENLLRETLPSPDMQMAWHKEIIDAIRSIQIPPPSGGSSIDISIVGMLILVCLAIMLIGFIYAIQLISRAPEIKPMWKVTGIAGLTAALGIGTLFSVNFFKDLSLLKAESFSIFTINPVRGPTGKPPEGISDGPSEKYTFEVRIPDVNVKIDLTGGSDTRNYKNYGLMDCGRDRGYVLAPFVEGRHDQLENPREFDRLVDALRGERQSRNSTLSGVVLIGSADKRPLRPDVQKRYESNAGLAQARALWVKSQLDKSEVLGFLTKATITLYQGPSHVGPLATDDGLRSDRSVTVCAVWEN